MGLYGIACTAEVTENNLKERHGACSPPLCIYTVATNPLNLCIIDPAAGDLLLLGHFLSFICINSQEVVFTLFSEVTQLFLKAS